MLTINEAKELQYRQELYHQTMRGSDNLPLRVRVNGKCKLWKRSPDRFQVPVKHGLYDSGYITETNCRDWCLTEDDAMLHPLRYFGDCSLIIFVRVSLSIVLWIVSLTLGTSIGFGASFGTSITFS